VNEAVGITEKKLVEETDKDKKEMLTKMLTRVKLSLNDNGKRESDPDGFKSELLESSTELIMTWLDKLHGKTVTENSIFSSLPRHYEGEYHKDMAALNVRYQRKKKVFIFCVVN
jgi:cysteinyl-tRNA synthetase